MGEINWRPETEEEEVEMIKHLDPEEREVLEAINDPNYVFPERDPDAAKRWQALYNKKTEPSQLFMLPLRQSDIDALHKRAVESGMAPEAIAEHILHEALSEDKQV